VKKLLLQQLSAQKNRSYVKPSQMKQMENQVLLHLDFMLPTLAQYAERTKLPKENTQPSQGSNLKQKVASKKQSITTKNRTNDKPLLQKTQQQKQIIQREADEDVDALLKIVNHEQDEQLEQLSQFSRERLERLVVNTQQAIVIRKAKDIECIVAMMKQNQLTIDDLSSQWV
jgi:hypothetical protein